MLAVLVSSCGGGGSPASPGPTPTPTPTPAGVAPVVLEAGNFETLVLGATRPCLVEFQLPT